MSAPKEVPSAREDVPSPPDETGTSPAAVLQDTAESAQAAEARLWAERLTTIESVTDALFTVDQDWRFTFLSRGAERLLKRPGAELLGRDLWTEFSAAIGSRFESEYRRAVANNETVEFEEFYRPLKTWFGVRACPAKHGLAVYFRDITERKQASALLMESRQRLALATESANMGVWDWDVAANKLVWDARMYTLYGIREQEFGGAYEAWRSGLHPDDRERGDADVAAALHGVKDFHTEFRVVWPSGEVRNIEAHALVQRAGDGSATRMIGINWDVTERKSSARAIEGALQRLSEAQRIGLIGDWEYDIATGSITWSPQVFEILGRNPRLGPPRDFAEHTAMYHASSRALMKEKVRQAIESGEPQQFDLLARRPDGEQVHVQAMALPKEDENGKVVSLHGTLQDISARKREEQAVRDRAYQQELIASLGRFALAESNLDKVFAEAASVVAKGLQVKYSNVVQWIAGDRSFVLKAGVGWDPAWTDQPMSGAEVGTRLGGVLASGKPVFIEGLVRELHAPGSGILHAHGIASGVELAIVCGAGPCGVIGGYSGKVREFSAEDLDFLHGIANILATGVDRTSREAESAHLAQYDPLTDLPNRLLLKDRLALALAQARRSGTSVAVLYLGLDRFKNVNDSFGHGLGDRLLQEVARRLTASVGVSDTVGRQGGDEFLIVVQEIDTENGAALAAEKLIESMNDPIIIDTVELLITVSIGIACFPDNGGDAETLLRKADAAMYAAKEIGRNCCQFYSEEMNNQAQGRLILQVDLSRAIERNELFLQFQPQVALGSHRVNGLEALVRWQHPTLGVIPPGQFIPVAEGSGLIVSIGTWVLEAACRQQAQWVRDGIARGPMAVNVSAPQFRQSAFVATVRRTLEQTGLEPQHLELELTESVVMHGIDSVREKLMALNKVGVKLAIDDFGTGYSSLSYLKQFPIQRLKIDRSFISELPEDKKSGAITQAVISMGHGLGMTVIAEGIETNRQAEYLHLMRCDDAQGFLYSRPLSPIDYLAFLRCKERQIDSSGN